MSGQQVEAREPAECGECDRPEDFEWTWLPPRGVEGAVVVCTKHGDLAPGWAYETRIGATS